MADGLTPAQRNEQNRLRNFHNVTSAVHPAIGSASGAGGEVVENFVEGLQDSASQALERILARGLNTPELQNTLNRAFESLFRSVESSITTATNNMIGQMAQRISASATAASAVAMAGPGDAAVAAAGGGGRNRRAGPAAVPPPPPPPIGSSAAMLGLNAPGGNVGGSQFISGGYVSAARAGNATAWPTGPIAGGAMQMPAGGLPIQPFTGMQPMFGGPTPAGSYTTPIVPRVPQGTGSPFAGYRFGDYGEARGAAQFGRGFMSGGYGFRRAGMGFLADVAGGAGIGEAGGMAIGAMGGPIGMAGMGAAMAAAQVVQQMPETMNNVINTSMLQRTTRNQQNWQAYNNQVITNGYGYSPADLIAAAGTALPWMGGRGTTGTIGRMAAFGEGTGVGLQSTANFFGSLGQAGWIGGAKGSMGFNNASTMVAAGMGMSPMANPQDWMSGLADLARQQQTMSVISSPAISKSLTGYYSAFNATGVAGMSGTAGAQLMGQINQGVAGALNQSPAQQALWYTALGGNATPAQLSMATTGGAFAPITVRGRQTTPFEAMLNTVNKQYAGFSPEVRAMVYGQEVGISTAQAAGVMNNIGSSDPAAVHRYAARMEQLAKGAGFSLTSRVGQSAQGLLGEIVGAGQDQGKLRDIVGEMGAAGVNVSGLNRGRLTQERLAGALRGGVQSEAVTLRQAQTSLKTSIDTLNTTILQLVKPLETVVNFITGGGSGDTSGGTTGHRVRTIGRNLVESQLPGPIRFLVDKLFPYGSSKPSATDNTAPATTPEGGSVTYDPHVTRHTTAVVRRVSAIAGRNLSTTAPLLTSTERQLETNLRQFLKTYGDALVNWQAAALASVGAPGAAPGGGDPSTGAGGYTAPAGGGSFVNPFSGWSRGLSYGANTDITLKGGVHDVERGQIFSSRAGTAIRLSQGAKYDAKLSDQYRSIFTLPNGQALSYMHGAMNQHFKDQQFLKAGTVIGTSLAINGRYTGTTPTGMQTEYQSYPGQANTGIIEFGVYDNPADAQTRNVAFGSQALDPNAYLAAGGVPVSQTPGASGGSGYPSSLTVSSSKQGRKTLSWSTMSDRKVIKAMTDASRATGVPLQVLAAQGFAESGWQANPAGGVPGGGWAQFMPGTAPAWGVKNRLDPVQAIGGEARMMAAGMKSSGGKWSNLSDIDAVLHNYYGTEPAQFNAAYQGFSAGGPAEGGSAAVNLPVSHPAHPHNQKVGQAPTVNIGNITVEITMPDGTVEKLRGKAKFDGVAGIHVKSTMPHHGNAIVHPANTRRAR